jgi:hypothetical protein
VSCGLRHLLANPSSPSYAWCRTNAMSDTNFTQSGDYWPVLVVCGRGAEPIRLSSTLGFGTQEPTEAKLPECPSAVEANPLATQHGWPGISAHAFALTRQIFAVQSLTPPDPRIREVHPEVSFAGANGPMGGCRWRGRSPTGTAPRCVLASSSPSASPVPEIRARRGRGGPGRLGRLDRGLVGSSNYRRCRGSFPAGADCMGAIWRSVPPTAPIGLSSIQKSIG